MRDWITNDFWWKLFSVFLAVAIWLTVHQIRDEPSVTPTSGNTLSIGSVPVTIISASADVHEFHALPDAVAIQVSGSPKALAELLQGKQIHAFVDLTNITNAAPNLRRSVQVTTPPGVTLVAVDPSEVGVLLPAVKEEDKHE